MDDYEKVRKLLRININKMKLNSRKQAVAQVLVLLNPAYIVLIACRGQLSTPVIPFSAPRKSKILIVETQIACKQLVSSLNKRTKK